MALKWYDCPKCKKHHLGRFVLSDPPDAICSDCFRSERDQTDFESNHAIRCPHCEYYQSDDLWEIDGIYEEGEIDVNCENCGKDFPVETQIEFTFRSPALGKDELE